jgi:hypothetical protein
MADLLVALSQILGGGLSLRASSIFGGILAIVCGIMIFVERSRGPVLVLAVFLVAGGVALMVVGILFRRPDTATRKRGTAQTSVDWRPPDADEVKKIVEGN